MDQNEIVSYIENMPDDVMRHMMFSVPWQVSSEPPALGDPDGFPEVGSKEFNELSYKEIQEECWKKFNKSPHIRTAITDTMGRLCGKGFGVYSDIEEIQDVIDEIMDDDRNRLFTFMPKYVAREAVEGELFLCLTVHTDGFVEIDFRDPGTVSNKIIHPNKPSMPLLYEFTGKTVDSSTDLLPRNAASEQIPSIFIAKYPELLQILGNTIDKEKIKASKTDKPKFKKLGGFYRFIVEWDKGFLTKRNISHISTTLEWLNHYENLKKYEIDHKKSSGAYVWCFECEDPRMFKLWLSMTEAQRAETGITAKKTPGSAIVLPPGFKMVAVNPNLTKISDTDTDIIGMVIAGLNKPADVLTGESSSPFASVKASRGPLADRMEDEVSYFERFLRYDLWKAIFFLRSKVTNFPTEFKKRVPISFDKDKKVVMKFKKYPPHKMIEFTFPSSNIEDYESITKALMGVKHGRLSKTLGIPDEKVAAKLGFTNYKRLRLDRAAEEELYPELEPDVDAESQQEIEEGEKPKSGVKKKPKVVK